MIRVFAALLTAVLAIAACSNNSSTETTSPEAAPTTTVSTVPTTSSTTTTSIASTTTTLPGLGNDAWREDLAFLRAQAESLHPNLYWRYTPEEFDAAFAAVDAQLDELSDREIAIEMLSLSAMIDGHSTISTKRSLSRSPLLRTERVELPRRSVHHRGRGS